MADKIKVGDTYIEPVRFHQDQIDMFAKISGDCNPLHINPEYAAKTPFGRPIVHGFFAGAVFSKVFGTEWPGEGTVYMYQDMTFRAPVYVEKDYTAKFLVEEVNSEKHRGLIKCTLEDTEGHVLMEGHAKLKHTEKF